MNLRSTSVSPSPSRLSRPHRLAAAAALAAALCSAHAQAQAQVQAPGQAKSPPPAARAPVAFDIPAGDMKIALDAFARQTATQLIYRTQDVKGLVTRGLHRQAVPVEALAALLEGTPLRAQRDVSGALVISVDAAPAAVAPRAEDETGTLSTVIVSATRRREPVRDVPMQVGTVATQGLERGGARNLQDYLANQAGIDAQGTGGPGVSSISMRGVSTGMQTIATVGLYIDDVAFGSSTAVANGSQMALDMGLLDLHHIEVLRGPQGTLYGASAMGGLLKYVTNEPDTYEFSGKVAVGLSATRGGGIGHTESVVLNAPLKEDVAGLRLSAFRQHDGGWVDTIGLVARKNTDRGDTGGARLSLLVQPSNRIKVRLTGTMQNIRRDGANFVDYSVATGRPIEGETLRRLYTPDPYHVNIALVAADVEVDLGWARLNSITSRQRVRNSSTIDMSGGYVPMLASIGLQAAAVPALVRVGLDKTTQEFRLTSRADKQFEWLAGLYINHERTTNRQNVDALLDGGVVGPNLLTAQIPASYHELAGYGDATWKTGLGLDLTAGLRVARNRQSYQQSVGGLLTGPVRVIDARSADTSRTWLLTARYALDAVSSLYARGASGYRAGGPNAVLNDPQTGQPRAPTAFKPDSLTSLEAGYKADLLDKRLGIEAAVFRLNWRDLQQYQPVNGLTVVVNAGAARINGAELNLNYRPDARWTLGANAAFIDAKLSEDAPGLGAKAGTRLPNSARFSASLSASYAFEAMGHPAYAGLSQRFVGARNAGLEGSAAVPTYWMPSYALTDLNAGVDLGRVQLAFYARNLFDRRAQLSAINLLQAMGGPTWVNVAQPRTVGMTATMPF